jgi:hypothetical protein
MNSQIATGIGTAIDSITESAGIVIDKRTSRRSFLRSGGRALGLAAAAALVAPAARTLAAQDGTAIGKNVQSNTAPTGSTQTAPGVQGIAELLAFRKGQLVLQVVPGPGWQSYMNPNIPLISFFYPGGWTPQTLGSQSASGTGLFANDQSGSMYILQAYEQDGLAALDLAWGGVQSLFGNQQFTKVYEENISTGLFPMAFAAGQGGGYTAVVTTATYSLGSGLESAIYYGVIARTEIFDAATEQVFLPIFQQLEDIASGGGGGSDKNNNGNGSGNGSDDGDDDGGDDGADDGSDF